METEAPPSPTIAPGQQDAELPVAVRRLEVEGRDVYLVGTAHVSPRSVEDVRTALDRVRPDVVCVELCAPRLENLRQRDRWRELDVFQVVRDGKAPLLLSSLMMASFQRQLGEKLGVEPGAELLAAVDWAEANDVPFELVDRDIQTTLRRTWGRLGWWSRMKLLGQLMGAVVAPEELDEEAIEKIKEEAELADMMAALAKEFPEVKATLIDERDTYLAQKIRSSAGDRVVAVVGAGHVEGIRREIAQEADLAPLETTPSKRGWGKVIAWAIPAVILALLAIGFYRSGAAHSIDSIKVWFGINGLLAALGASIALGHPLTVLSAFLAAPLTSLNPLVAAGWVAGLVQAWVRRPTVGDLERLPSEITSVKGFWRNPVSRVLLVVVLSNLGSTIGTLVAGSWIAARTLS